MKTYVEPFPLCDAILLKLARTPHRRLSWGDLKETFPGNTDLVSALGQLVNDRYVIKESMGNALYTLIASGSQFISDGGYKKEFETHNLAEEIRKQVDHATVEMSKAITAVSVATTKNARMNNTVVLLTLAVAFISAMGTAGSWWISYQQGQRRLKEQMKAIQPTSPASAPVHFVTVDSIPLNPKRNASKVDTMAVIKHTSK